MINERYLFFKIIIKKVFESEANLDFLISIASARQNKKIKKLLIRDQHPQRHHIHY